MFTTWMWPKRDRDNYWERVRTIARDVGEPIVHILEVPGAFIPGASKALEKVNALFGSDLNISELDSAEVLEVLDGAPGPFAAEDGSNPVFLEGVKATVTIAHNGKGQESILLERVDVSVIEYRPSQIESYEAQFDATKMFGAGFVEPMRFFIDIGQGGPDRARRISKIA